MPKPKPCHSTTDSTFHPVYGRGAARFVAGFCAGLWLSAAPLLTSGASQTGVTVTPRDGHVRIEIDGEHFTDYVHSGAPHVYFYPLLGPDAIPMTRNAPMKQVDGEDPDHPHHRSLWFAHGAVNGVDFWAEGSRSGKIVHDKLLGTKSGRRSGELRAAHRWIAPDGKVMLTDETTVRVHRRADGNKMFDFEVTLRAPKELDVVLGDTKEGTMAIRLAETMRLKPNKFNQGKPPGTILQSTGVKDGDTWGKRAAWCDYSGLVQGKTLGVAIFDHPHNPRHPTWWHVRDYGLFAANPFGVHDFEKKPAGTGDLEIPAGTSVTFKYRFFIHRGHAAQAKVAEEYKKYAPSAASR